MYNSNIIHHNDNFYKIKYKILYSTFTNKKGEFVNDILVEYKKHLNVDHVLKVDDKYLCFCDLILDAKIIEETKSIENNNETPSVQSN